MVFTNHAVLLSSYLHYLSSLSHVHSHFQQYNNNSCLVLLYSLKFFIDFNFVPHIMLINLFKHEQGFLCIENLGNYLCNDFVDWQKNLACWIQFIYMIIPLKFDRDKKNGKKLFHYLKTITGSSRSLMTLPNFYILVVVSIFVILLCLCTLMWNQLISLMRVYFLRDLCLTFQNVLL